MRDITSHNFGLLIAYVIPGVTALWGTSYFSPTVRAWLGSAPAEAPTVGGFLYLTIASVAAGLVASTVRWAILDTFHHWTGVPRPAWDFSRLQRNISAFHLIVEHQYRFYQAYSNSLVSLVFVFIARRSSSGAEIFSLDWMDAALIALVVIFFMGSRDTLKKYVERGNMLFGNDLHPSTAKKCRCCGGGSDEQLSPQPAETQPHPRVLKFLSPRHRIRALRHVLYLRRNSTGEKDTGGQPPATKI